MGHEPVSAGTEAGVSGQGSRPGGGSAQMRADLAEHAGVGRAPQEAAGAAVAHGQPRTQSRQDTVRAAMRMPQVGVMVRPPSLDSGGDFPARQGSWGY